MGRTKLGLGGTDKTPEAMVVDYEVKIASSLKNLQKLVVECYNRKLVADESLQAIEAVYDKSKGDKRGNGPNKSKLKTVYSNALKDSESAASKLRDALAEIAKIRRMKTEKRVAARRCTDKGRAAPIRRGALMVLLQQSANTLPLWIGKLGENPPALCGAIGETANHVFHAGDAVAALVKGEEEEDNWILAEIVTQVASGPGATSSGSGGAAFEIEDVDEEQKERYVVWKRRLIPLPSFRANPHTHPHTLFPTDAVVLALYPQTTCFYKGVVEQVPVNPNDDYLVAFEDSSYPHGYSPPLPVPQRYVVAYKEIKKN